MAQRSVYTARTAPDTALASSITAMTVSHMAHTALSVSYTALTSSDMALPCDNTAHTAPAMFTMTAITLLAVHVLALGSRLHDSTHESGVAPLVWKLQQW